MIDHLLYHDSIAINKNSIDLYYRGPKSLAPECIENICDSHHNKW